MKQERKFRFVGDPLDYSKNYAPVEKEIYPETYKHEKWGYSVEALVFKYPEDWEEVTEQEEEVQIHNRVIHSKTETTRIPNQDQPASSMTKFEMAVFMAIQGLTANPELLANSHEDNAEKAIEQATELFKQLENIKK